MSRLRFKIKLLVLPTEVKGRLHAVHDGYRPDWKTFTNLKPEFNGAMLNLPKPISLGELGEGFINPVAPEFWDKVVAGTQLGMFEGSKLVGVAVVECAAIE